MAHQKYASYIGTRYQCAADCSSRILITNVNRPYARQDVSVSRYQLWSALVSLPTTSLVLVEIPDLP